MNGKWVVLFSFSLRGGLDVVCARGMMDGCIGMNEMDRFEIFKGNENEKKS